MVAVTSRLRYLLDTNVLSEAVRVRPNGAVLARLHEYRGEVATGTPVWHELLYGTRRLASSRRCRAIEHYLRTVLETVPILPYDVAAANWHAAERARLATAGATPPFVDGQIAAIASANDLVLVTRNTADFQLFAGLQIENWWQ